MNKALLIYGLSLYCLLATAQLNGNYTINQNHPTSSTNFRYFNHAVMALNQLGVSGPVVFDVVRSSGPYVEQIKIDSVAGASATNTVSFIGNGEILTYAPFNPIKRHIIRLSGAKHLVFEDLIIKVDHAATYGWCVQFKNDCDSIRFSDCVVVSKSDSNKNTYVCFAGNSNDSDLLEMETGPAVQNLTIDSCVVLFGSYSLFNSGHYFHLGLGTYPENVSITNSLQYRYSIGGVFLRSNSNPAICKNYFISDYRNYFASDGVKIMQGEFGYQIANNVFFMAGQNGIQSRLYNLYTTGNLFGNIINNMIGFIQNNSTAYFNGIFLWNTAKVNVLSNNVYNKNGLHTYGVQLFSNFEEGVNVLNNSLYCASGISRDYPLVVPIQGFGDSINSIDYNNYYSDDTIIYAWDGKEYANLDSIRQILYHTDQNHNSISVPPGFFSPTNLHTNSPDLDSAAFPIPSIVSTDIDGEQRHGGFPDIGADEYTYDPNNPYCSSYGFTTRLRHIEQVCVGSGCYTSGDDGGYGDYTHISGKFNRGGTYPITLTPDGGGNIPWPMVWRVWIDLNHDGDFKDSLELVFSDMSKDLNPATGSITIPANAATGPTRLRIQMGDSLYNECDIIALGETEDYSVILSDPYCNTGAQSTASTWIEQICVNAVCIASGNNGGYRLVNTAQNLNAGNTFSISLTPGFSLSPFPVYWKVFLDGNHDGDYYETSELLFSSGASNSIVTGIFTIPPDALNGRTRLRFEMSGDSINTPCNPISHGEVEVFQIGIVGGQSLKLAIGENNEDFSQPPPTTGFSRVAIWPNPASSHLFIDVGDLSVAQVRVLDFLGGEMFSEAVSTRSNNPIRLNTTDWPSGMYVVEVVGSSGKVWQEKIIVQ